MNIEFKFSNDVFASVDLASKTVYPYTRDMYGELEGYRPINYANDNEMVLALKKVSEMVNLDQHRYVVECMYDFFNLRYDCTFDEDGLMIWHCDNHEKDGIKDALKDTGAVVSEINEHIDGVLFTSIVFENNVTRIAKIIYYLINKN
jgi:hypothetical protein